MIRCLCCRIRCFSATTSFSFIVSITIIRGSGAIGFRTIQLLDTDRFYHTFKQISWSENNFTVSQGFRSYSFFIILTFYIRKKDGKFRILQGSPKLRSPYTLSVNQSIRRVRILYRVERIQLLLPGRIAFFKINSNHVEWSSYIFSAFSLSKPKVVFLTTYFSAIIFNSFNR